MEATGEGARRGDDEGGRLAVLMSAGKRSKEGSSGVAGTRARRCLGGGVEGEKGRGEEG